MATFAQEKAARQRLLRDVGDATRALETQVTRFRRLVQRQRGSRSILDEGDGQRIVAMHEQVLSLIQQVERSVSVFAQYLGR